MIGCFVNEFWLDDFSVEWLDHSRTLREQGVLDVDTLLLRRKFFFSDRNVDQRDPVQLNLLYVQVTYIYVYKSWSPTMPK